MNDLYLDETEFLRATEGRSLTGKWDVLVSYHCEKLNDLLASSWRPGQTNDTAEFIRDQDNCYNSFRLKLGTPKLSFRAATQEGHGILTIPIHGTVITTYRKKAKETQDWIDESDIDSDSITIPEGQYQLRIEAPLRSVQGSSTGTQAVHYANSTGAGNIVSFGDKEDDASDIVLQFSHHSTRYSFDQVTESTTHSIASDSEESDAGSDATTSTANDTQTVLDEAMDCIKAWFVDSNNVKSIQYRLATVKSVSSRVDSNLLFKPKSFVFTTSGDILCIYIQTEGSDNPPGDAEPKVTRRDGSVFNPMPRGSTASIIIRHSLLREKVFLPQLEWYHIQQRMSDEKLPKAIDHKKGFKFELFLHGDYANSTKADGNMLKTTTIHAFRINLDAEPTSLTIEDNKVKWNFSHEYKVCCHRERTFGFSDDYDVHVKVMAEQVSDFATVERHSELAIDFSLRSSAYSVSTHSNGKIPRDLESLKLELPTTTLTSSNLNFAAAESLLIPGANMMEVKSIYTPYDVVLVGDLVGVM